MLTHPILKLSFSPANAKTKALAEVPSLAKYFAGGRKWYSVDLLSGWSCPMAKDCKAKVHEREDGSRYLVDGKDAEFRCFSASQEVMYTNTYKARKRNFELFKQCRSVWSVADIIQRCMPKNAGVVRPHVAGDFFSKRYFLGWCRVAEINPDKLFYAYTKRPDLWLDNWTDVPPNFILTASYGGKLDHLIAPNNLRSAIVVYSVEEAEEMGLPIDHDDSHAADPSITGNFALLIHGGQKAGSQAGKSVRALKGLGSYSRK